MSPLARSAEVDETMKSLVQSRWICWKCQGALQAETVSLQSGIVINQYGCLDCLRKWPAGVKLQRAVEA
jgi:hypothetical protein